MKTRFLFLLFALACIIEVNAQQAAPTSSSFLITVTNPRAIVEVNREGDRAVPVFENPGVNSILNNYQITEFKQAYPTSNYEYLRQMWRVTSNSVQLARELKEAYPQLFPYYEELAQPMPLATPNDWNMWYDDYLDFINAPTAWDCSTGDPNVLIGITDTYFYTSNPDLGPKIAELWSNVYPSSYFNHGTLVAGLAAGATNNSQGYPSIGWNCMLRLSNNWGDDNELLLMSQGPPYQANSSRVLNGSWGHLGSTTLNLNTTAQGIYNEIYENGTIPCFGAGNGYGVPDNYFYPASYDHNISVTSVGWENVYNGINNFNVKDIHEITIGDVSGTYQHNDRVDICAPGIRIGGLEYDPSNPTNYYQWDGGWGTSFASPMTAGTLGLMVSANKWLSPYQLEYILKMNATDISMWLDNVKYGAQHTGKLGSGRLNAGNAVCAAKTYNANTASTQTFYVKGIELNSRCKPGMSTNGVIPTLTPILVNGTGPYTYRWEALGGNTAVLSSYTAAAPQIVSTSGSNLVYLRLTVYDNSLIRKVANKIIKIQLTTQQTYDLAMRDAEMDMFDEPNQMTVVNSRDWNIWLSPDLWNRQAPDGGVNHQNPEYFVGMPNYMYARVRNVGCAPSTPKDLRMYWTKASTGEKWAVDWTTVMVPDAWGGFTPGGGQITTAPVLIPALQPGTSVVLNHPWYPQNPANFKGSPANVEACALARIEEMPGFPHGMTFPEVSGVVTPNVKNNNNIVTRNFIITDLKPGNQASEKRQFDFASASDLAASFRLEVANDRFLNPSFAGDFASMASATLYLGDLFDRWQQGGMQGNVTAFDQENRTVTFEGNEILQLDNITLNPGERFSVDIEFTLDNGATLVDSDHLIHVRQFDMQVLGEVYGNITYAINIDDDPGAGHGEGMPSQPATRADVGADYKLAVYPNPAKDKLSIYYGADKARTVNVTIFDVAGRELLRKEGVELNSNAYDINITTFIPGVYFIEIADDKGMNERFKFIKQ